MKAQEKKKIERPYLNFDVACEYLGLAPQTVYQLTHRKQISFYKLNNRKLRFTREDLDDYLEKHICHIKSNDQIEIEAVTRILTNQKWGYNEKPYFTNPDTAHFISK